MPGEDSRERLALPAVMDLAAAGPLLSELRARRGGALTLDGSEVHRVGGLCLQVLLAADAAWREDGRELRIEASEALASGLKDLGAAHLAAEAAA